MKKSKLVVAMLLLALFSEVSTQAACSDSTRVTVNPTINPNKKVFVSKFYGTDTSSTTTVWYKVKYGIVPNFTANNTPWRKVLAGTLYDTVQSLIVGTYQCQIQLTCGDTSKRVTFMVTSTPSCSFTPTITNTTPTTFCPGGSVVLKANPSLGAIHQWKLNGVNIVGATDSTYAVYAAGVYTVAVTVSGCTATSAGTTVSVTSSAVNAVINTTNLNLACGAVNLTASGGLSYTWLPGGQTTATISALTAGTYTVTASGSCASDTQSVVVINNTTAIPTIFTSGSIVFCQSGNVTLTASPATSYLWSTGAITPSITVSTGGNYFVTSQTGTCGSAISASLLVVVNSLPAVPIVTSSSSTAICQGGSVILSAPNGYTYLWSNSAIAQSIPVTTTSALSVIVTDANGCSKSSGMTSVIVNSLPVIAFVTNGPTTFCQGGSVTVSAIDSNPNSSAMSWLWITTGATAPSVNLTATGVYQVTITNTNGCSATNSISVVATPLPNVTIISSGTPSICLGDSLDLIVSGGTSFSWTSGQTTQTITVGSGGTYYVTATNGGCSASASFLVTLHQRPTATIVALGSAGSLTANVIGGTAPYDFWWSIGAITQSISVSNGTYQVTVTDFNGCTASAITTVGTVGIEEYSLPGAEKGKDKRIFNLLGQEVIGPLTPNVIYIQGGKKIMRTE